MALEIKSANQICASLGKDVRMPERLAENPLLLSRVVRDQADEAVPATLQARRRVMPCPRGCTKRCRG
jgi:hypothetical protein